MLWLAESELTDEGLSRLPQLDNLEAISVAFTAVSRNGIRRLGTQPKLSCIMCDKRQVDDDLVKHFTKTRPTLELFVEDE